MGNEPRLGSKVFYKIGEVSQVTKLPAYVLRFWETQFPQLKPNKSGTGQRLYRRREVELALEIKRLVHGEGYTIAGAKQALEGSRKPQAAASRTQPAVKEGSRAPAIETTKRADAVVAAVGQIRAELREIASLLSAQQPRPSRPRARLVALSPESGNLFPL